MNKYTLRLPLLLNTVGYTQACGGFRGDALSVRPIKETTDLDGLLVDMITDEVGFKGKPIDIKVGRTVSITVDDKCVIYTALIFPMPKGTSVTVHIVPVTDEVSEQAVAELMPHGVLTYAMNTVGDRHIKIVPGGQVSVKPAGYLKGGLWCGRCTRCVGCPERARPNASLVKDLPDMPIVVSEFKLLKACEGALKRLKAMIVERAGELVDPTVTVKTTQTSSLADAGGLVDALSKDGLLDNSDIYPGMPATMTHLAKIMTTGESAKKNTDRLKSEYSQFFKFSDRNAVNVQ